MRNNKQMRILHFFFSQEYLDFVHTLLRQVFLPVFVSEDTDFTALRNINEINLLRLSVLNRHCIDIRVLRVFWDGIEFR